MKKGPGGIDYNHFLEAYNPTHVHHELDGSTLSRSTSRLPSSTTTSNVSGNKPSLFQSSSFNQSQTASSSTAAKDDMSVGTNTFAKKSSTGIHSDLKRVWHVVLKECHRADPERNGQVSRATFISALQMADSGKVGR